MANTGEKNGLTDIHGILVGNCTEPEAASGITVAICPEGAIAAVDVQGAAPCTRETDLLEPLNLVEKVHAIVLCGGSVYGLAACDGVVKWLSKRQWGFPLSNGHVAPIVPAAALFDLGRGKDFVPPISAEWGLSACDAATDGHVSMGSVGAGTGAVAGGIKGGLGSASEVLESGITVAALVAVNSLGSVIDPCTGTPWEIRLEMDGEFRDMARPRVGLSEKTDQPSPRNTTIGIMGTDARLTKAQAQKVAQMAHDGLGRAIRPAHTMFDGDTIFCLATGKRELPEVSAFFDFPTAQALNEVGRAAADCFSRAIIHAVLQAEGCHDIVAFRDLDERS